MKGNQSVTLGKIEAALVIAMDDHISNNCAGCIEFIALFPINAQFGDVQFRCLLCNEIIQIRCKRG